MTDQQALSYDELREIYDDCGGDLTLVAERLDMPITALAKNYAPASASTVRRRTPPADIGKSYFRAYIVSIRHAEHSTWPIADQAKIEAARAAYEAGTHEMCQGRDRDWFVLYSVPRQKRCGARKFFHVDN